MGLLAAAMAHAQAAPAPSGERAGAAPSPPAEASPPTESSQQTSPAPTLTPGRYATTAGDRWLELTLRADGGAVFGGAPYRWAMQAGVLELKPPGGEPLRLTAATRGGQPTLLGSPFGPLIVRRLPPLPPDLERGANREPAPDAAADAAADAAPEPAALSPRPFAWRGTWLHRGPHGEVVLRLVGDGSYTQTRLTLGQPPRATSGRWSADFGALILHPAGGGPTRYAARRDGPDLELWGGDLPQRVRFEPDTPR